MKERKTNFVSLVTDIITTKYVNERARYLGTQVEDEEIIDSMATGGLVSAIEQHTLGVYKTEGEPLAGRRLRPSDAWIGPGV